MHLLSVTIPSARSVSIDQGHLEYLDAPRRHLVKHPVLPQCLRCSLLQAPEADGMEPFLSASRFLTIVTSFRISYLSHCCNRTPGRGLILTERLAASCVLKGRLWSTLGWGAEVVALHGEMQRRGSVHGGSA